MKLLKLILILLSTSICKKMKLKLQKIQIKKTLHYLYRVSIFNFHYFVGILKIYHEIKIIFTNSRDLKKSLRY